MKLKTYKELLFCLFLAPYPVLSAFGFVCKSGVFLICAAKVRRKAVTYTRLMKKL